MLSKQQAVVIYSQHASAGALYIYRILYWESLAELKVYWQVAAFFQWDGELLRIKYLVLC